jgi:hypothetical protein
MKPTVAQPVSISRSLIVLSLLFPLLIACSQLTDRSSVANMPDSGTVEGVWELSNHYYVKDGDTLYAEPAEMGLKHKMYLDGYVMWSGDPSYDSTAWYGYGTYILNGNTLVEKLTSMSLPLKTEMGSENEIVSQVAFEEGRFKQETNSILRGTIYLSVEVWKKLDRNERL